jgi:hypothetical protein
MSEQFQKYYSTIDTKACDIDKEYHIGEISVVVPIQQFHTARQFGLALMPDSHSGYKVPNLLQLDAINDHSLIYLLISMLVSDCTSIARPRYVKVAFISVCYSKTGNPLLLVPNSKH